MKLKNASAIMLFALVGALLIGCSSVEESPDTIIRFGYAYNAGQIPGLIAEENGMIADPGISVEFRLLNGGKDIVEALLADELDVGLSSTGNVIPAAAKTDDIVIIAATSYGGGRKRIMVREDLSISEFKELKGKKIAVRIGGTQHKNLLKIVQLNSMSIDDFDILNMKSADALVALQTGDIDAYVCGEPDCATIQFKNIGNELMNFEEISVDPNVVIASKEFAQAHPDEIVAFLRGWIKSIEYTNDNLVDSKMKLSVKSDVEFEIIEIATKHITYGYDLDQAMLLELAEDIDFLYDQKSIDKKPMISRLVDLEYLNDAKK